MTDTSADTVNTRSAIASFVLLGTIGVLSFIVQPALVQGFVTVLHMSESRAVDLAGVEMAGVAAATILLALLGERVNWRLATAVAIVLAAAGNAWSALSLGESTLWAARCLAGFGHGGLISLSFTFVGLTRRVERNLAIYLVSLLSYGALGIWVAPGVFAHVGLASVFATFAVATLASLGCLRFLPHSSSARMQPSPRARDLSMPQQATALAGVLVYNLAQGIAWAILFLVGTGAGLGEQPVANALFASQVMAVAGALGAVYLAERWRRGAAIVTGIVGGALCIGLLLGPLPMATYAVAVCGFNLLWNFVLPFILGAVGDMDRRGRMMSPAIAMQMTGLGLGPILTARLIGDGDYRAAEWLCVACFAVSLALLAVPLAAHRRLAGTAARAGT